MGGVGSSLRIICGVGLIMVSLAGSLSNTGQALAASSSSRALILLPSNADTASIIRAIELAGSHVTRIFPSTVLIADVPVGWSK
jgi:hypothetical protein